jgi:hypothetical protein
MGERHRVTTMRSTYLVIMTDIYTTFPLYGQTKIPCYVRVMSGLFSGAPGRQKKAVTHAELRLYNGRGEPI